MTDVHIDVFLTVQGRAHLVGHGDIPYSEDMVANAGHVASLLHKLAWEYEEHAQREIAAESGQFQPRVAINRAGDRFYEIAPDQFVGGMSYDDAVQTHQTFGGASSLENLRGAYPDLKVLTAGY